MLKYPRNKVEQDYSGRPSLELTALKSNIFSGYTIVTHPFHPLSGKKFEILANKYVNGRDVLSLRTINGVVAVLREWTDKADFNIYENDCTLLSAMHLKELSNLVYMLSKK